VFNSISADFNLPGEDFNDWNNPATITQVIKHRFHLMNLKNLPLKLN